MNCRTLKEEFKKTEGYGVTKEPLSNRIVRVSICDQCGCPFFCTPGDGITPDFCRKCAAHEYLYAGNPDNNIRNWIIIRKHERIIRSC